MHQKKLLAISTLLALSACGHYSPPETFEAKMARYQVRQNGASAVPKIEPIHFSPKRSSRGPASVSKAAATQESVAFSNKKLYFIALYHQYNQLAAYSSAQPREINQCPSFHSALVDHSQAIQPHITWTPKYDEQKLRDDSYARYHPELFLSMDESSSTPRALDIVRQDQAHTAKHMQEAIDLHVGQMYSELAELCEYGSSDNYYAFENLNTEMKRRHVASAGTEGMSILLKTTIFSNKALLESLKRDTPTTRAPASVIQSVDYDYEVMKRLGVPWAQAYYRALKVGP